MHMAKNDTPLDLVFDAYRRLSHDQLVLFLRVRSLPTTGSDEDLVQRLSHYDIHTYHFPNVQNGSLNSPGTLINGDHRDGTPGSTSSSKQNPKAKPTNKVGELPVEVISEILDHLGDWELSKAVGVPTSLSRPPEWTRASSCDEAILTGYLPVVRAANPSTNPPTRIGALLAIRFSYTRVLDLLYTAYRPVFLHAFPDDVIPIKASRHNRVDVLHWWKHVVDSSGLPAPTTTSIAKAMDEASRGGSVAALDWWLRSSNLPLDYTTTALENASTKNHIPVLSWWHSSGLPLKISTRVMDVASSAGNLRVLDWWARSGLELKYDKHALHHASAHGRVEVLDWWLGSGLQMKYDMAEVLTVASRHNRPEVLEWWDHSRLPLQYRMCDIEEALEDAIGGGEAAREWWQRKGVDFYANDKQWMTLQTLN